MTREMNLNEWLVAFEANKQKTDSSTACNLGFYDWFCKNSALMGKIRRMAPTVKRIIKSGKVNPERCYVFFKNNCPLAGKLYDSFSICDIDNGNVIYWVRPSTGEVIYVPTDTTVAETTEAMREYFRAA